MVLELDLPDMSGFEVLFKLVRRIEQPEIAVIILTRLSHRSLLQTATKNGAQAALRKSSTAGDILNSAVRKATSNTKDREPLIA